MIYSNSLTCDRFGTYPSKKFNTMFSIHPNLGDDKSRFYSEEKHTPIPRVVTTTDFETGQRNNLDKQPFDPDQRIQ